MLDDAFPSEDPTPTTASRPRRHGVAGVATRLVSKAGHTRIDDLAESGGWRVKFPSTHGAHIEAVVVNTGGGVVGGDHVSMSFSAGPSADATIATSAAERVYRTAAAPAEIDVALRASPGACLAWLPQETILFSGARLKRRFEVDVASTATLLMAECLVFGRIASGEEMGRGLIHDVWRVRRDSRLVFAEAMRLDGDIARLLARPAIAAGARAAALILLLAADAEERIDAVRRVLADARSVCGASAWNGMLTVRFLATEPADMRRDVMGVSELLHRRPLPRVWTT